jgi:hypothetical protein
MWDTHQVQSRRSFAVYGIDVGTYSRLLQQPLNNTAFQTKKIRVRSLAMSAKGHAKSSTATDSHACSAAASTPLMQRIWT